MYPQANAQMVQDAKALGNNSLRAAKTLASYLLVATAVSQSTQRPPLPPTPDAEPPQMPEPFQLKQIDQGSFATLLGVVPAPHHALFDRAFGGALVTKLDPETQTAGPVGAISESEATALRTDLGVALIRLGALV